MELWKTSKKIEAFAFVLLASLPSFSLSSGFQSVPWKLIQSDRCKSEISLLSMLVMEVQCFLVSSCSVCCTNDQLL